MQDKVSIYSGSLLGMAVGDAMGYTVDGKSWQQIQEDYGPNGLMGYDLVNGQAEVTSYTQIAAYSANGLLMAISRGRPEHAPRFVAQAMKEWYKRQHFPRDPEPTPFWVARLPELRRKFCMDPWLQDAVRQDAFGTPDALSGRNCYPGALTVSAMVGLFYDPKRMDLAQLGTLAEQIMSLTHGDKETILCAVTMAYTMASIATEPELSFQEQLSRAVERMARNFSIRYVQAEPLADYLHRAIRAAETAEEPQKILEEMTCNKASQCLAGAMFAALTHQEDFDSAMILAVNHSGRSAAVGALAGALLGGRLGEEALPEFYLESLEPRKALLELAKDLSVGSPTAGLFDDVWAHKYS